MRSRNPGLPIKRCCERRCKDTVSRQFARFSTLTRIHSIRGDTAVISGCGASWQNSDDPNLRLFVCCCRTFVAISQLSTMKNLLNPALRTQLGASTFEPQNHTRDIELRMKSCSCCRRTWSHCCPFDFVRQIPSARTRDGRTHREDTSWIGESREFISRSTGPNGSQRLSITLSSSLTTLRLYIDDLCA